MTLHDDDQLEAQLRDAFARRAATTTIDEPPGVGVRTLRPSAGARPDRRRILAAAAAVVALVGGLLTATRLATNRTDRTEATVPGGPQAVRPECGGNLPFELSAHDLGYEGPFPGPAPGVTRPPNDVNAPDDLRVHWTRADGSLDVSWPSYPPIDPTTPWESDLVSISDVVRDDGNGEVSFSSTRLGTGACAGLGITVTTGDRDATAIVIDQLELAIAGPGGPLAISTGELVTSSEAAQALPTDVVPCSPPTQEHPSGTMPIEISSQLTDYSTPDDALLAYVATDPGTYGPWWTRLELPDGSMGYAYRDPIGDDHLLLAIVHVVDGGTGWRVESGTKSGC